ncbi:unnamed protein product, partial [Polarella glacialis]
ARHMHSGGVIPGLTPRQCNATIGSTQRRKGQRRCGRSMYPNSEFLFFLRNWNDVQGFIGLSTAYFIHLASLLQCDLGISGAIGEIGVAAGKSFTVLAFTRRANESMLACDLFAPGVELDNVPEANVPMFLDLLDFVNLPKDHVSILRRSSLQLTDLDLLAVAGGAGEKGVSNGTIYHSLQVSGGPVGFPGFRLFHVDGAHYAEATLSDLNIAACSLVPGGIVLVDDMHNLRWPGVQEGFHRFMNAKPQVRQLEPFLFTGRLFLTTPGYAEAYRQAFRQAMPALRSRPFYGVELLTSQEVSIAVKDFEDLIAGHRPRADISSWLEDQGIT